ncbi:hypothetical protein EDB19DRAFT_1749396 [Suillus lakei]|nr:hypothetical protein EDB19DRAFT_1749396 [Suillus lakei]
MPSYAPTTSISVIFGLMLCAFCKIRTKTSSAGFYRCACAIFTDYILYCHGGQHCCRCGRRDYHQYSIEMNWCNSKNEQSDFAQS